VLRRCVWSRNIKNRCSIYIYDISSLMVNDLTLILLTWRKWWTPNNASKWQMGFNSVFKGLKRKMVPLRNGRHVISWTKVETVIRTKSQVNSKTLPNYSIMIFTFTTYFQLHTAPGYAHCHRTASFRTNQHKIVTFVEDFTVLGFYTGHCW